MDLMVRVYLERAENELSAAQLLQKVTENDEIKKYLDLERGVTFYSSVISHSYYGIFYGATAILLTYQTIPQANKEPAEQSIQNALTFIRNIKLVLEK